MPGKMGEFRVSADRENLGAFLAEVLVDVSQFAQFCRADKGEICWVEE